MNRANSLVASLALLATLGSFSANANANFFQGFETDNAGWDVFGGALDATRVPSGTGGITSASGSFHATVTTAATRWGGYSGTFPAGGYTTSLQIYLDPNAGYANDTRFDFSSAVSTPATTFRRDFVFNAGFYNDDSLGNRFVINASTNAGRSGAFPKNTGFVNVFATGWYTFSENFHDNGSGVLAVDYTLLDPTNALAGSWTRSDPSDVIGVTVGGNRYGWFVNDEFPSLAIDNTSLVAAGVPEPASLSLLAVAGLALVARRRN